MERGEKAVAEVVGFAATGFQIQPLDLWQQENLELKRRMGVEIPGEMLSAADLPEMLRTDIAGADCLILPDDGEGAIRPAELLKARFCELTGEALKLSLISTAVLLVILFVFYRRRAFHYALPIFASIAATAGMIGWCTGRLNFFHILCFFLIAGLGIDYVIFHNDSVQRNLKRMRKTVLTSALTSVIGFGMLAATSFEVTRSIGLTLACGLSFAYFFSLHFGNKS